MFQRLVVITLLGASLACSYGTHSTTDNDPSAIQVSRPKYYLRHWVWSGIFPVEGGLISDPHIYMTDVFEFPDSVSGVVGPGRYQGFDINPWFRDSSTEALIAIEQHGEVFEYAIENVPPGGYAFINMMRHPIISLVVDDHLAFVSHINILELALFRVELPLRHGSSLRASYAPSTDFDRLVEALQRDNAFLQLKPTLCGTSNVFRGFYERFEPCDDARSHRPGPGAGAGMRH